MTLIDETRPRTDAEPGDDLGQFVQPLVVIEHDVIAGSEDRTVETATDEGVAITALQQQTGRYGARHAARDGQQSYGDLHPAVAERRAASRSAVKLVGSISVGDRIWHPIRSARLEKLYAAGREYTDSTGRRLIMVSYMDSRPYDWLTDKVDAGQRTMYKSEGVWKPDAKGTPVRGKNVKIWTFMDPETHEPVAALREVRANNWDEAQQLPSFVKVQGRNAFYPEGLDLFERRAQGRGVSEIAGLWKTKDYPADVRIAMYQFVIQRSMDENRLWFMGAVPTTHKDLVNMYGPGIIHTIGSMITVEDRDAARKTRMIPNFVDPSTLHLDLLRDIAQLEQAGDSQTAKVRRFMFWQFIRGREDKLSPRVVAGIKGVFGHA